MIIHNNVSAGFAFTVIGLICGFFLFLLASKPEEKTVVFIPIPSVPEKAAPRIACTEEAKMCPDGSSVGRIGLDCQFAPCPGEEDQPMDTAIPKGSKRYYNEKYAFGFQYPDVCGEVKEKSEQIEIDDSCLSMREKASIDKIARTQLTVSFEKRSDESKNSVCDVYIKLLEYDERHYYEYQGYEGMCHLNNILSLRGDILTRSNVNTSNVKGLMTEWYWPPGMVFVRDYTFVLPTYMVYIKNFIDAGGLEYETNIDPASKQVSLDAIVKANKNNNAGEKLENTLQAVNTFLASFTF
jgi:hypothetical protein